MRGGCILRVLLAGLSSVAAPALCVTLCAPPERRLSYMYLLPAFSLALPARRSHSWSLHYAL